MISLGEDGEWSDDAERILIESNHGIIPWFEGYGWITTKERKLIQPEANPYQIRCADAIAWCLANDRPIRLIKLKPRQKGSSTISMAELYWLSRMFPINSRIIGGQYDQVFNLWQILKTYASRDTYQWDNSGLVQARSAQWTNESYASWETAGDSEAGRSGTFQAVVATEAARWREEGTANATAVITGLLNCVPFLPHTLVILESTAAGDFGMFYDYWQDAADFEDVRAGKTPKDWNGYIRIFSPWFEHSDSEDKLLRHEAERLVGTYSDDERTMVATYGLRPGHVSWYRRTMRAECKRDPIIMMREFPGTPEEAFHAASKRRFNTGGLRILEAEARQAHVDSGYWQPALDLPEGATPIYAFAPCPPENATTIIAEPPVVGRCYIIGVDIATGASQTDGDDPDRHSISVLRDGYMHPDKGWQRPKLVAWTPVECMWDIDILTATTHALSRYYGDCLIIPEANNDRGLIRDLLKLGANVYERMTDEEQPAGARTPKPSGKYGVVTKGGQAENTRNWMIEKLARRIREWDTIGDGIEVPDIETVKELKTFIVRKSGRAEAADGKHDDRVLSLAIASTFLEIATLHTPPVGERNIPWDLRGDYGVEDHGDAAYS